MNKLSEKFESVLVPLSMKISNNSFLSTLAAAFIRITPITVGVAVLVIIGNLPIPAWTTWVTESGMKQHFDAILGGSTNALSLFVVFGFASIYADRFKENGIMAGYIALASFIMLLPQTIAIGEGEAASSLAAIATRYIGGDGIIIAILTGYVVGKLFVVLNKKGIVFKMPAGVPPNVSESLSPMFIAMIIFCLIFAVRVIAGFTPYGNIADLVQHVIGIPFQSFAANPFSITILMTLAYLLWFFGIHPNVVYSIMTPLLMQIMVANIGAYQTGEDLPYRTLSLITGCISLGGGGNTLGLVVSMLTAKSERYKAMFKIAAVPNIFNINEPLVFGMPMMLNPVFFIPMVLNPLLMVLTAWLVLKIPFLNEFTYNPTSALLPWTTPIFVKAVFMGGWKYFVVFLACFAVNIGIYFPFFKIADKAACEEEALAAAEALAEEKANQLT